MNDMIRVSSTEFDKEVGRYQEAALRQPVMVTRDGRDRTMMISAEEYYRLKRRDRRMIATEDVPSELVEAVRNARMDTPPRPPHRLNAVTLPKPEAGLVIRCSSLWLREHREGREEGVKDRPCAIILATFDQDVKGQVLVVPVTHSPPTSLARLNCLRPSSAYSASMRNGHGSCPPKATCSIGPDPICAGSGIATIGPSPTVSCRPASSPSFNAAS